MKPLDRFLMLERARPATPEAGEAAVAPGPMRARFGAVTAELPVEVVAVAASAAPAPDPDPFAPPPALERGYELASRDRTATRATIRCIECGLENARYEHDVCGRCDARLDTRPVHQLNERLHQDERAVAFVAEQAAAKARAEAMALHAERRALQADADAEAEAEDIADQRLWIDRAADRIARGPLARLPVSMKRLLAVALVGGVFGLLYAATGSALVGFLLALVVVAGLCMVPM